MAIVNINGVNYSSNVIVGAYKINESEVYTSWTDANGNEHRQLVRKQVSGSFDLQFRNMAEYNDFVENIKSAKEESTGGDIGCDLFVNNTSEHKSCNCYIKYTPTLTRQYNVRNYIDRFTVEVVER